jgi:hypothetical protein
MVAILVYSPTVANAGFAPGSVYQFKHGSIRNMSLQAKFTYGSGGTSVDAYVQSSIDGVLWTDNAEFSFATTSARVGMNLSSLTAITTAATLKDGTLTANTAQDGIVGSYIRVKLIIVAGSAYAGTTLQIDCITDDLTIGPALE